MSTQVYQRTDGPVTEAGKSVAGTGGAQAALSLTNPGDQSDPSGDAIDDLTIAADGGGATLAFTASGLPGGLSVNSSTGVISGTPATPGLYPVVVVVTVTTASIAKGITEHATFAWTIT